MTLNTRLIQLETVDSTNNYIHAIPVNGNEMVVVSALFQTNGYGQKGNHWEAEKGKNLLVSIAFRPGFIPADRQFILSQAVSLSIRDTLCQLIPDKEHIYIKWPNDIYYKNRKICGFLVSCDLENGIPAQCTAGIGLNVNQEQFLSDAPNPISLKQIIHEDTDLETVRNILVQQVDRYYSLLKSGRLDLIESDYYQVLYHRHGLHLYKDRNGLFQAEIAGVSPQGILSLRDEKGQIRSYAFKEVIQFTR